MNSAGLLQNPDTSFFPVNSYPWDRTFHASNTLFCHIKARKRTKISLKLVPDPKIRIHQPRALLVQNKLPSSLEISASQVIQFHAILNKHSLVGGWGTILKEKAPIDRLYPLSFRQRRQTLKISPTEGTIRCRIDFFEFFQKQSESNFVPLLECIESSSMGKSQFCLRYALLCLEFWAQTSQKCLYFNYRERLVSAW